MLVHKGDQLKSWSGSAETSYLQNFSVKLFKEHFKVQICKGKELNKHFASVPILLIVLNYVYYIVCLSIQINMFKLKGDFSKKIK